VTDDIAPLLKEESAKKLIPNDFENSVITVITRSDSETLNSSPGSWRLISHRTALEASKMNK